MTSRRYLAHQARALIEFAKSTSNAKLAAALLDRAADFKELADEKMPAPDSTPQAPDVEPSPN